ncbi:integral membrane protein [Saccharothrix sp. NRRL B-16348]|nr:integral membrane protein [Saccharothrix sp. NRRL B-16348]
MVCYGLVHVLLAALTAQVVLGDTGEKTDQKGAVSALAQTAIGPVLLWVLAIGLFAFAVWQLAMAASGYGWVTKKRKRLYRRCGSVGRAITGTVIGIAAVGYATGSSQSSSTEQSQTWTARVLALPFGQVLVGAVALFVLGLGVAVARKGVKKSFEDDLNMSDLPAGSRVWVEKLGRIGWIGKGAAYFLIGVLVAFAAVNADPEESGGMDKALHTLAAQPYGVFALAIIAVGFLGFGAYCFAAAKAHKG